MRNHKDLTHPRERIRRLRHALEVGIASMHECSNRKSHHTAKETLIRVLHEDKKIARSLKASPESLIAKGE